jgi:hypothetical protein
VHGFNLFKEKCVLDDDVPARGCKADGTTGISHVCIITEWMPNNGSTSRSSGMLFLGSRHIVHRALKSLNIHLDASYCILIYAFWFSRCAYDDSAFGIGCYIPVNSWV